MYRGRAEVGGSNSHLATVHSARVRHRPDAQERTQGKEMLGVIGGSSLIASTSRRRPRRQCECLAGVADST
jgi:hypothetical protein